MKNQTKFLEFNGKALLYLNEDGETYVAVKPICEALNVVYTGQLRTMKKHHILGPALYLGIMQVPNDQARKMTCIPEKYVYGWIFSINSDKPELLEFQKTCYELLFNYFHGQIGNRKDLLIDRKNLDTEIHIKEQKLKKADQEYQELQKLKEQRNQLTKKLNGLDKKIVQTEMQFSEN